MNITKYWCSSYRLSTPNMSCRVMKTCVSPYTQFKGKNKHIWHRQLCTLGNLLHLSVPKTLISNFNSGKNNAVSIHHNQTTTLEYNEIIFVFQLSLNNRKYPARSLRQAVSGFLFFVHLFTHSFISLFNIYGAPTMPQGLCKVWVYSLVGYTC